MRIEKESTFEALRSLTEVSTQLTLALPLALSLLLILLLSGSYTGSSNLLIL